MRHASGKARLRRLSVGLSVMIVVSLLVPPTVFAGPPFRTDDPEPVDYQHWEFYAAAQYENDGSDLSGTAPHLELNYGVAPNFQLHLLIPDSYSRPKGGPTLFGPGNTELGVKYRFVEEGRYLPMIGAFPLLEIPTGSRTRGLGTGHTQLFFPVWIQKSPGSWTTYGGGGYWINPGTGNRNYWYLGWLLQRDITKYLTIGLEAFHVTPSTTDGEHETGYNAGALVNLSEKHHIIGSAGRDMHGPANFFFYVAYLMTWGPPETGKELKAAKWAIGRRTSGKRG
jgi:hypothetical protein